MSHFSPKRQPLSLVHNKSNSTTSSAGSGSPGSSSFRKKLPSIGALSALYTSPKASLETSREGRASLSFSPFEPYRLPGALAQSSTSDSGKLRARATTISAASTSFVAPSSPLARQNDTIRSPPRTVAALGPARRTRSKTLSKSQSHHGAPSSSRNLNKQAFPQQEDAHNRRSSCTFVQDDNLQRTLDLLEQHVEEQGRRLSLSSSSSNTSNPHMLSAPMMQRSPVTPMSDSAVAATHAAAGWTGGPQQNSLSPPTLLPPYMPGAADLELVFPTTSPGGSLASSTSSQSSSVCQATLTPQVEQLSNLISDLSLFLPQADSLSSDQLKAIQTAVDSILGKTPLPSPPTTSLGNPIQLRNDTANNIFADDMPTFHVGGLSSSLHNAPPTSFGALQTSYDPSTPQDVDMLDMSIKSHFSHLLPHEGQREMTGLQVQHNPPPYEARTDFSNLDFDLGLVPPRW